MSVQQRDIEEAIIADKKEWNMYCMFCGKEIEKLMWETDTKFRVFVAEYECDCGKFIRFVDTKGTDLYATVTID